MNKKLACLYLLVFGFAAVIFMFLLFPGKKVAAYLSNSLTGPAVVFSTDTVRPGMPLELNLVNARATIGRTLEIVPETAVLRIKPTFSANPLKVIQLHADVHKGSLKGHFKLKTLDPLAVSQTDLTISDIKIKNFNYKTDLADINLSCDIAGQYRYDKQKAGNQSGHGTIAIREFSASLKDSFFNTLGIPSVTFSTVNIRFTQHRHKIKVQQVIAKGSGIDIHLNGTIEMATPLPSSTLRLKGVIQPESPYLKKLVQAFRAGPKTKKASKDGIEFNLSGTLEQPKIER